jgi:ketosteroid isomerase-like protein
MVDKLARTKNSSSMNPQESGNIDTVKEMYRLFAIKDYDKIREIFHQDIRWNQSKGFPGGGQYVGADAVFQNVFDSFGKRWTNWKATITRYLDSGDGVFAIGFYEGKYNETGKFMRADFACEYKIRDGKICEFNQFTDTFLIGRAMGLTKEFSLNPNGQ